MIPKIGDGLCIVRVLTEGLCGRLLIGVGDEFLPNCIHAETSQCVSRCGVSEERREVTIAGTTVTVLGARNDANALSAAMRCGV